MVGDGAGPREDPVGGFPTFAAAEDGPKQRVRAERFADHFSQARQFYVSQTPIEQDHIADAFVFELSKCEQPGIRARMVANLRNVDEDLAPPVADGLGCPRSPIRRRRPAADHRPAAVAGAEHRRQRARDASPGARSASSSPTAPTPTLLAALRKAAEAEGALVELVAPKIGGVVVSDGTLLPAHQKVDGGPSVLYDAVAIIPRAKARRCWPSDATAKDFVTDAHAHCKFIAYTPTPSPLLEAAGVCGADRRRLRRARRPGASPSTFIERCRALRYWARAASVDQT